MKAREALFPFFLLLFILEVGEAIADIGLAISNVCDAALASSFSWLQFGIEVLL